MFIVEKEFKFEAAHRLHKLPQPHPCSNLHGHSYKVKVAIGSNTVDPDTGFVIDFGELKSFQKWLDENLDHATILSMDDPIINCLRNGDIQTKIYTMNSSQTSAEHMAQQFADLIYNQFKEQVDIKFLTVKVWETAKNCAEYMYPVE